ncbi:M48 family metalloprotease [Nitrincola nitratireducens]|uniref:Putative beta-barrel assembly-enhancing protease n=1 Tax=Nitrincola nitratireducens TaxID=1229521 RepID=W9UW60_9GAMM|nr:M48 family metalloprotease [Nitrincola nitratireducens]EXJ11483.1 Putative Zn-dependent protease, contains TPR repeat [Nitrincola nitratireducens]
MKHLLIATLISGMLFHPLLSPKVIAQSSLPTLSDSLSSSVTLDSEYRLGRNWVRMLRGQAPLLSDPLTWHYVDDLLWDLVPHSQINDRRLELVMVDNPTFNAFAVPGGIVGVHGGLILASENEDELASVLAHELAHLSQRHFAQRIEEERRNRPMVLAGILAGILIAAADTQGGTAVLSSTMAASAQSQLAFSRRNEEEADRVGMQNLVSAGRDPHAMPQMFSRLQRNYRFYGQRMPEFLLSHPVTEARIADSLNRAAALPTPRARPYSPDFDIIRTRMQVHYAHQANDIYRNFQTLAQSEPSDLNHYGAMLAATRIGQLEQAHVHFQALSPQWRQHMYIRASYVELLLKRQELTQALTESQQLLRLYAGSLPILKLHAKVLRESGQAQEATAVYKQIVRDHPNDVETWYELAEAEGLVGNIAGVHDARIEYFLLTGNFDSAIRQVEFARRERNISPTDQARLDRKEAEIHEIRRQIKEDF